MKNTLIVMSTNRQIEKGTERCVIAMRAQGAAFLLESGSPDVAFARCRALSMACDFLRENVENDVVLMLDDDMEIEIEIACKLVEETRARAHPCSAVYSTVSAKLAAQRWKQGLWLVGLGCLAIPRALLLQLEERSESFEFYGRMYSAFTWCGPENGGWVAEDFRLSMNLGGVNLLPLAVGHIKKGVIWPNDETLELVAKG